MIETVPTPSDTIAATARLENHLGRAPASMDLKVIDHLDDGALTSCRLRDRRALRRWGRRAGWHTTDKLVVPRNLSLVVLPSRSPELNPVENVWQYLSANWLSNSVSNTYPISSCDALEQAHR